MFIRMNLLVINGSYESLDDESTQLCAKNGKHMLRTLVTYGVLSIFIAGSAVAQQSSFDQRSPAKMRMSQAIDPNKCIPQCVSAFNACTRGCIASSPQDCIANCRAIEAARRSGCNNYK
jgi:hypothetical protein